MGPREFLILHQIWGNCKPAPGVRVRQARPPSPEQPPTGVALQEAGSLQQSLGATPSSVLQRPEGSSWWWLSLGWLSEASQAATCSPSLGTASIRL